jgi:hypothetical protein
VSKPPPSPARPYQPDQRTPRNDRDHEKGQVRQQVSPPFLIAEFDKHYHDRNRASRLPEADPHFDMDLSESLAPIPALASASYGASCSRRFRNGASDWLFTRMAGLEEWAAECTVYGMRRYWISIVVITASVPVTFGRSPNPDLSRAEEL